ncbi:extracellular solute-binding protein [Paenibacillus rigui]|uniref:ABC transporter substrate-binding protein n=1 Tax=Paenibacillus rigui TaxID=554312 RepID=A0A229UH84_9BACL|nr:extracellular solute-binding protein [Paenibacillus rigui]OXM82319.1 ABC transporter substrate-binding protein [Paenibacillus rigui]
MSFLPKYGSTTLVSLLALSLAACSSNPAPKANTPAPAPAGEKAGTVKEEKAAEKTIKITYRKFGSADSFGDWLKPVAEEFEKTHPGVKVKFAPIIASEGDFFAKLALTMKSPDTAPEVVAEDTFMISSDVAAGLLEPMDQIKSWPDWNNFFEPVQNGMKAADGKVYGIPYSTDTRGMFYNTNIFKKAGLPVPWEPKSWDDILAAAQAIKSKVPDVTPFWINSGKATGEATTMQTFEMLLYGTKDTLFENGKWVAKSPGFLDSLKFINDIYKKGLGPELSQVLTGQAGDIVSNQMMPKEKVGIVLNGNWVPSAWKPDGPAPWKEGVSVYQLAAMPTQKGEAPGYTSMSGGWALSIGSKSKEKELGLEFIKLASTKESIKQHSLKSGDLSPRKDVAVDPEYTNAPGTVFKQATSFLAFTHYRPGNAEYPQISTQIQALVEGVATGTLTPEKAMEDYAQNVKRIVGEGKTIEK